MDVKLGDGERSANMVVLASHMREYIMLNKLNRHSKMKMILWSVFPVFSFLLLAAHFMRSSDTVIMFACLLCPFFLLIQKWWVARLLQAVLLAGAGVWIVTLIQLVQIREQNGQPWLRLAVILGIVVLWTGFSAWLFQTEMFRKRYQ